MNTRIVQLVPWRDILLALTDQGEIYRLVVDADGLPVSLSARLVFPGIPS